MIRIASALVLCAALAGCGSMAAVDQSAVDAAAKRIEPLVVRDCAAHAALSAADSLVSIAVPGVGIISKAADVACADPAKTARDIAIAEELAKGLRAAAQR